MSFMAGAFSEPTLIRLASGFEHVTQARRQPTFLPTLPVSSTSNAGDEGRAAGARARSVPRGSMKPKHL
jgi:hypothetical protein